ncbi:integrase core domain-containing protein [Hymenobacter perfusus]|uniref:Integrase catalytic domain-containing protein n=1 Tax=Hymenobacter perfusus TaxID=1236770 RepID=A0A428KHE4_9BACT|nr:integrase core domain-containing protein [Hymenobacter perfusus]RSK45857.1 hypothetical protein EI293_01395 [Hymenobacter perfusus]
MKAETRTVPSDQGCQYTTTRFHALVAKHGAVQSMSRRGNWYYNAHTEPFWSRIKAELLDEGSCPGVAEVKLEISHHIACYNAEQRHSSLSYQAPNYFKTTFKQRPNAVRLSQNTPVGGV